MENFAPIFTSILSQNSPDAIALVEGNEAHPNLGGWVCFYSTPLTGILICGEIFGLPDMDKPEQSGFYGMHIHENGDCTMPFSETGNHYNPTNSPHPFHAGDLPPLLGNHGYAWFAFYDHRLTIPDVLNRSLIVHLNRDDFTTQPSGDSGEKIGCGVIQKYNEILMSNV